MYSDLVNTISSRLGQPEATTIGPKFVKIGARLHKTCGKNSSDIQNTLSIELNAMRGWLEYNILSIHLGKTESIVIASEIRLARTDSLKISYGSVAIDSKSKITYLGLKFDSD